MTDWQPIETAPKDGTWIIAYSPGKGVKLAVYADEGHGLFEYDSVDEHGYADRSWFEPTHWMPLPEPPK